MKFRAALAVLLALLLAQIVTHLPAQVSVDPGVAQNCPPGSVSDPHAIGSVSYLPCVAIPQANGVYPQLYADFSTGPQGSAYWYNGLLYPGVSAWNTAIAATFSRSSTASYTNSGGLLTQAASNALRFDYDPITMLPKGILLEGASTNNIIQSNDFSAVTGAWIGSGGVIGTRVQNATGPDGVSNSAFTLTNASGTGIHRITNNTNIPVSSGATYTFSIYGKAATDRYLFLAYGNNSLANNYITAVFDLGAGAGNATQTATGSSSGTISSATLSVGPNGFFRATLVGSITATGAFVDIGFADAATANTVNTFGEVIGSGDTGTLIVYGAQLEQLPFASSYIPTTSGTVTRAADSYTSTALTPLLSGTGSSYAKVIGLNGYQANNFGRIISYTGNAVDTLEQDSSTTGSINNGTTALTFTIGGGGTWSGGTVKAMSSYDGTGRSVAANNGTVATDANTQSAGTGNAQIGASGIGNATWGNYAQIGAWNIRASNSELQRLTTLP